MYEIINESTSKLWVFAPVIAIGVILYIITAIIEKQISKLNPFEDKLEKDLKFSKMVLRIALIGITLLLGFPIVYYSYAAHIAAHPQGAVTYQKDGNKLVFTSHNFIINDSEFEIESETDDYYVIKKHDNSKEYFQLDKSELESLK